MTSKTIPLILSAILTIHGILHAAPPLGRTIALRSQKSGNFMTVGVSKKEPYLNLGSQASMPPHTHFVVEEAGGDKVRLKAVLTGKYLQLDNDSVRAQGSDKNSDAVKWQWVEVPGTANGVQLKSAENSRFLDIARGRLQARGKSRGEVFVWQAPADGLEQATHWSVIPADPRFPTTDVILAICQVTDDRFQLPENPAARDCTRSFQAAIDFAATAGGGTVFVPEGQYRVDGPLTLPASVLLQGRWCPPTDPDYRTKLGTVIRLESDALGPDGSVIDHRGGQLSGLTFWHPGQDPLKGVKPYPWILKSSGAAFIENITFLNAWRGIQMQRISNCNIKNIYGSAYDIGMSLGPNYAIPRVVNHCFSSEYLGLSGLEPDPARMEAHKQATYATGTAMEVQRLHGFQSAYGHRTAIRIHKTGHMSKVWSGGIHGAQIRHCQIGVHFDLEDGRSMGVGATSIEHCGEAIRTRAGGNFTLSNSNIIGSTRADLVAEDKAVDLVIHNSLVDPRKVHLKGGSIEGRPSTRPIAITQQADMQASAEIERAGDEASGDPEDSESDEEEALDLANVAYRNPRKLELFSVRSPRFSGGARGDGIHDDSAAIQAALDAAHANGGGFVLFPAGHYRVTRNLSVGDGIQVRGSCSGLSAAHAPTMGSSFRIETPPVSGDEVSAPAFLTLGDDSGVRGMAFFYPHQTAGGPSGAFRKYPYTIRGMGKGNYVMFCRPINPYRFVHFSGDDNLIAYNQLSGIRQMVFGTNNRNGLFKHNLTKPTNWWKSGYPFPGNFSWDEYKGYVMNEGFEILHLKDCDDYHAVHTGSYAHGGFRGATIENSSVTGHLSLEQYLSGWAVLSGNKNLHIGNKTSTTNRDGPAGARTETFGTMLGENFHGRVTIDGGTVKGRFSQIINVQGGNYHRRAGAIIAGLAAMHVGPGGSAFLEGIPIKGGAAIKSEGTFKMRGCTISGGVYHKYAEQLGADNTFDTTFVATRMARRSLESYGLVIDPEGLEIKGHALPQHTGISTSSVSLISTNGHFDFKVENPGFLNTSPHPVMFSWDGSVPKGTTVDLWYYSDKGWIKLEKTGKNFKDHKNLFLIKGTAFGKQQSGERVPDLRLAFTGDSPLATSFTLSTKVHEPFAPKSPTGLLRGTGPEVHLSWKPDTDQAVTYRVYRRRAPSGALGQPIARDLREPRYTDRSPQASSSWHVVTAVDAQGRESCISEAVGPTP